MDIYWLTNELLKIITCYRYWYVTRLFCVIFNFGLYFFSHLTKLESSITKFPKRLKRLIYCGYWLSIKLFQNCCVLVKILLHFLFLFKLDFYVYLFKRFLSSQLNSQNRGLYIKNINSRLT